MDSTVLLWSGKASILFKREWLIHCLKLEVDRAVCSKMDPLFGKWRRWASAFKREQFVISSVSDWEAD